MCDLGLLNYVFKNVLSKRPFKRHLDWRNVELFDNHSFIPAENISLTGYVESIMMLKCSCLSVSKVPFSCYLVV